MTATVDARAAQQLKGAIYEGDILIRIKDANGQWGARIGPISPVKLAINPGETQFAGVIFKFFTGHAQGLSPKIG